MNREVVAGWALAIAVASSARVSAQDGLTFTLDEVTEAAQAHADVEAARERTLAESMGGLRWGMSKSDLLAVIKDRIRVDYEKRVKAERDIVRQDVLYQEGNAVYRRVREGFVAFDGRKTGWDASPVVDEFRHGSNESMLFYEDADARHHYFFINGRLWKWYRELKAKTGQRADYERVLAVFGAQLGRGKPQTERRGEGGDTNPGMTWQDPHTRVTLLRRGAETCLVFEDVATLGHLSILRARAKPRGPKTSGALEQVLMTPEQREAWRDERYGR